MIYRIALLLLAFTLFNCSSSKPVVRTKADPKKVLVYKKPAKKTVSKTTKNTSVATKKASPKKPSIYDKPKTTQSKTVVTTNSKTVAPKPEIKDEEEIKLLAALEKAKEKNESSTEKPHYKKEEVLQATSKVRVTTNMLYAYIDKYKDIAKNNMEQYGIPASIILAQGILESGTGKGSLSLLANNHFGIKCKTEWTGPSVFFDDDAEQECFRKYDSGEDSYTDHALFLTSRSYYIPLFSLEKDDYKAWAYGLKKAGYATDVKYPTKLITLIEKYNLDKYDSEVLGKTPREVKEEILIASNPNDQTYEVAAGDTLYSISRRFNISVPDLVRKNNISNNALSIGQNLIVN